MQIDLGRMMQRFFEIWFLAFLQAFNRAFQQFGVHAVSDFHDLTTLFFTQQFTSSTNFQVVRCQGKTGTQRFDRLNGLQTFAGIFCQGAS